jgi:hypothetical protein
VGCEKDGTDCYKSPPLLSICRNIFEFGISWLPIRKLAGYFFRTALIDILRKY